MATRLPSKQEKGAAAAKQLRVVAEVKSRRALEDIGNNVLPRRAFEVKPDAHLNRRVTRSFGAQLIAHAHARAPTKIPVATKKQPAEGLHAKNAPVPALEPVTVIVISPRNVDPPAPPQSRPSRKKVETLSSVLTARSKVAGGVSDIDAGDVNDQFAVVEYVEELHSYYKESESRPPDYMGSQLEINARMRSILADWLIEVHHKFELMPETLYLTVSIVDRYLSLRPVKRRELQLVGMSAMLVACKYEEIWAPEVNDFVCISDKAYTGEAVLRMEKEILQALEWSLTVPTVYVFLTRFLKAAAAGGDKGDDGGRMESMAFFFAELAVMQYGVVVGHLPSMVAAAAVLAARCTLAVPEKEVWTPALRRHTGYKVGEVAECAGVLVECHAAVPTWKLQVVYKRYSGAQLGGVALIPPATGRIKLLMPAGAKSGENK